MSAMAASRPAAAKAAPVEAAPAAPPDAPAVIESRMALAALDSSAARFMSSVGIRRSASAVLVAFSTVLRRTARSVVNCCNRVM